MSNGDLSSMFGGGFDPNAYEPQSDYDILPPGKYPVLIEKAEVKQTKAQTGHFIKLEMTVLDGPCKNRKLFDNININNPNPKAVEIGLRTLAALGQALGIAAIQDTSQLLNQACVAHVKVKNEENEIRTYSALTSPGTAGVPQQPPTRPPYQPPQQTTCAPPQNPTCHAPQQPYQPPYQPQGMPQQPANYQQPQQQPPAGNKPPWAR